MFFMTAATYGVGLKLLTTGIFGAGFFTAAAGLALGALTGDFDGVAFWGSGYVFGGAALATWGWGFGLSSRVNVLVGVCLTIFCEVFGVSYGEASFFGG